ncbi:hypothetical protein NC653_000858 [Populus alba x Populus x berolinensis]|uniref:Uncharacterized protein n=1 Tax=Populus alba x Populus x berolinensis TaxID=444605 RepID=A0AAD6RLF4_9ROSI|nr:hypothetical protein NC653_000858 [Populus alba x Populus x berolinensis]
MVVYFLDGESILEVALCHFTSLSPRKWVKDTRACLLGSLYEDLLQVLVTNRQAVISVGLLDL